MNTTLAAIAPDSKNPVTTFDNVKKLDRFPLVSGPPKIEVPSNAILFDGSGVQNINFEDKIGYQTEFTEETKMLALMVLAPMASLAQLGGQFAECDSQRRREVHFNALHVS